MNQAAKRSSRSGAASTKRPQSASSGPHSDTIQERLAEALGDYVKRLSTAYINTGKTHEECQKASARAANEALLDAQKRCEDINREYIGEIREAWGREDALARYEAVYRASVTNLEECQADLQKRAEATYEEYVDGVGKVVEDTQNEFAAACRQYVEGMKKIWADIDPKEVDLATLVALGYNVQAAAFYASATLPGSSEP